MKDTLWNDGTFILSHDVIETASPKAMVKNLFQTEYVLNINGKINI